MNIDEAKALIQGTPISTILGRYLSLQTKGRELLAHCPFHNDRDPSLKVIDDKQMWWCFPCNRGGDAIKFVQDYKHLNFPEAVTEIAEMLGITIESKKSDPRFDMAMRVLEASVKLYRKAATSGQFPAYADFVKERGLQEEICEKFQIGFAPPQNALLAFLQKNVAAADRTFALQVAEEIGIIKKGFRHDGHYDKFRERIMFPMKNESGKVIAYSSRRIREDQGGGKYVNSDDSFIFHKKNLLFGLYQARSAIREKNQVILVEGHMDAIAMAQFGFTNTVALMGTAMSEKQRQMLTHYSPNVVLALDNDRAGLEAKRKINREFLYQKILPKVLDFSPHKDADEFLQRESAERMQDRLQNSVTFLDAEIDTLVPPTPPKHAEEKLEILKKIFELVAPLGKELSATERVVEAANKLGIRSSSTEIVGSYVSSLSGQEKKIALPTPTPAALPPRPTPTPSPREHIPRSEKGLVETLIQHKELFSHPNFGELIDFVTDSRVKNILYWLQDRHYEMDESEYIATLKLRLGREELDPSIRECVANVLLRYTPMPLDEKRSAVLFSDIRFRLQLEALKRREHERRDLLAVESDENERMKLMNQIYDIQKEQNELKNLKGKA